MWRFLNKSWTIAAALAAVALLGVWVPGAKAEANFAASTSADAVAKQIDASFGRGQPAEPNVPGSIEPAPFRLDPLPQAAGSEDPSATYLRSWGEKLSRPAARDAGSMVIEIKTDPEPGSTTVAPESAAAASAAEPLLIPLPPAVWTGLSGFVGLGVAGMIRRGRRWIR